MCEVRWKVPFELNYIGSGCSSVLIETSGHAQGIRQFCRQIFRQDTKFRDVHMTPRGVISGTGHAGFMVDSVALGQCFS
jgi:hypothetical protein